MGEFINEQNFDDVIIENANDLPSGDRLVLHRVDQILVIQRVFPTFRQRPHLLSSGLAFQKM
jgi:hypothetical protein